MATPLKKARTHRSLKQHQVATRAKISQAQYHRIERGDPCSAAVAERLARIFRREGLTELHILYPRRRCFADYKPAS